MCALRRKLQHLCRFIFLLILLLVPGAQEEPSRVGQMFAEGGVLGLWIGCCAVSCSPRKKKNNKVTTLPERDLSKEKEEKIGPVLLAFWYLCGANPELWWKRFTLWEKVRNSVSLNG